MGTAGRPELNWTQLTCFYSQLARNLVSRVAQRSDYNVTSRDPLLATLTPQPRPLPRTAAARLESADCVTRACVSRGGSRHPVSGSDPPNDQYTYFSCLPLRVPVFLSPSFIGTDALVHPPSNYGGRGSTGSVSERSTRQVGA